MKTVIGVVEDGRVVLPPDLRLPEGSRVLVEWDESDESGERPRVESEPLAEEDIRHDIEWATGHRWKKASS